MSEKILGRPPVALIVGASSGMGEALVHLLVREGYHVAAVARRAERLKALAQKHNHDDKDPVVRYFVHDVTEYDAIPELFASICKQMNGLDLVVYSSGVMPPMEPNEYNFAKDHQTIEVNVLGAMAWLNQAAERFGQVGAGHIVGIGSVAGDRGRFLRPAYHTSKAALETYLESLRNRLAKRGVSVTTIKPGPVRTPMTEGLRVPMPVDVDVAAEQIWDAIRHRKTVAYVPRRWALIMWVIRNIPSFIFRRLSF